jgi:hypothetical protein
MTQTTLSDIIHHVKAVIYAVDELAEKNKTDFSSLYQKRQETLFKKYEKNIEHIHNISEPTTYTYLLRVIKEFTEPHHIKRLKLITGFCQVKLKEYFLLILQFLKNIEDYVHELKLILSKLIFYLANGTNKIFILLVKKALTVKKIKHLSEMPSAKSIPEIEKQIKKIISEENFIKAYNLTNNSYDEIKFTTKQTELELEVLSNNLAGRLYYVSVDKYVLESMKQSVSEVVYKDYLSSIKTTLATVDANSNIYLWKNALSSYDVLVKTVIHEIAHLKSFKSSTQFYPFSVEKIGHEAGDFLEDRTFNLNMCQFDFLLIIMEKKIGQDDYDVKKLVSRLFKNERPTKPSILY